MKKSQLTYLVLAVFAVIALAVWYLHDKNFAVLNPKGPIAAKESHLIIFTFLICLIVVIPVYVMTVVIAWRYRESNTKAKYSPDFDRNGLAEFTWWAIPSAIIMVLAVITWNSSHQLDPFKPVYAAGVQPITIEVVALQWKWLFIYPQQNIASVNFVEFPVNTPVNFDITSDAPMNSFWIPQLGGQIYAMPGMSTELHLEATSTGSFRGSSANISGQGFAQMDFIAKAGSQADFKQWLQSIKRLPYNLSQGEYVRIAKPSTNNPVSYYSSTDPSIYQQVVLKYMPDNSLTGHGDH